MVLKSSCFDDGEEVTAEFGIGGGGEEEGDYNLSESCLQEGGKTGAYAGGSVNAVDVDDAAGVPEFGEGFELGVEDGVAGACPEPCPEERRIYGDGSGSGSPIILGPG